MIQIIIRVFFLEQAKAIQQLGHEVVLLYADIQRISKVFSTKCVISGFTEREDDGVPVFEQQGYIWIPRLKNAAFIFRTRAFKKLYNHAIKKYGRPDILHAQSCLWAGVAAVVIKEKDNLPLIISEHSSAYKMDKISAEGLKWASFGFSNADSVIFVSDVLRKSVVEKIGIINNSVIIPNMVNIDRFGNIPVGDNSFTFLTIAGLNENKSIDLLIKAFSIVQKDISNVKLLVIGEGPERRKLEDLTEKESLHDFVGFLGSVRHDIIGEYISKSDVFVLPSKYETFGVVFIEALACGKPVIAAKCGGPEDIVNAENGILVDVDDIDGLANAMISIYDKYETYDKEKSEEILFKSMAVEMLL